MGRWSEGAWSSDTAASELAHVAAKTVQLALFDHAPPSAADVLRDGTP